MTKRQMEIARMIAGIRVALGLPLDGPACARQALACDNATLTELHARLGALIKGQNNLRN